VLAWLIEKINRRYPEWHIRARDIVTIFALLAITWFAFTGRGIIASQTTPDNLKASVRQWLDDFHYASSTNDRPTNYFGFNVTMFDKHVLTIEREKDHDMFLVFGVNINSDPSTMSRYNALTNQQKVELDQEIRLELAREKIDNGGEFPSHIVISDAIPITDNLNESAFHQAIQNIDVAQTLIEMTIALDLDRMEASNHLQATNAKR
jgi:hypothetical protein